MRLSWAFPDTWDGCNTCSKGVPLTASFNSFGTSGIAGVALSTGDLDLSVDVCGSPLFELLLNG